MQSDGSADGIPQDPSVGTMVQRMYDELRRLAAQKLARLPPGQSISPTSLVHEVFTRLSGKQTISYRDDREFFLIAGCSMRDVLVERARHNASLKAGGNRKRVSLDDLGTAIAADDATLLDIDALVLRLRKEDETDYQIVMLRFYAGLSEQQASEAMNISLRTLQRRWHFIRARLYAWLSQGESAPGGTSSLH